MILISNKICKIRFIQIWGMETKFRKAQGTHNDKSCYNSQDKKEREPHSCYFTR